MRTTPNRSGGDRVSDREAAIRWEAMSAEQLDALVAELADTRERLAHEQLRTQHEVQRWQEAEAREAKLREALRLARGYVEDATYGGRGSDADEALARIDALADGEGET